VAAREDAIELASPWTTCCSGSDGATFLYGEFGELFSGSFGHAGAPVGK